MADTGKKNLNEFMTFRREGGSKTPLVVFDVNGSYIVGVYQGSLSKFDILIKYRQKKNDGKWSHIRTPKHIHWAADMLIKLHEDRAQTQAFLDFLIGVWKNTLPVKNIESQQQKLAIESLLGDSQQMIKKYEALSSKGEYSIKFLILLAKLLMIQEKTNLETAYMFGKLLDALRRGDDIFSIVSTATHNGR